MNFYIKIMLSLGLINIYLFASHNHGSEIKKLEAQGFAKLAEQLRTNTPANISSEIERLHEIALQQAENKAESLQKTTTIFGAAAMGALLSKASERALPSKLRSYRIAETTSETEAAKMFTGIEFSALAAFLPSGETIFYNAIVIGGLYLLYQANKAIHAPCRATMALEEHKWGNQLRLIRKDTERRLEDTEKILENIQIERKQLELNLSASMTEILKIKANQLKEKHHVQIVSGQISEVQKTLELMSRNAAWDLKTARKRVEKIQEQRNTLQQEHQASVQQERNIGAMIRESEIAIFTEELELRKNKGAGAAVSSSAPQRSMMPVPQDPTDTGAGVWPTGKSVEHVGLFGCYRKPKKPTELR